MTVEIDNLSFSYNHHAVLHSISMRVQAGEQWAIIGKNGAGKSTLIKCLAGLEKPQPGKIRIFGKFLETYTARELATIIAYVPQVSGRNLPFSVYDYVMMGRFPYQGFMAVPTELDRTIVMEALRLTDTQEFSDRPLSTLSGGEQQRVLLAGAVAQQTRILLLDEPTTFLDPFHQQLLSIALERVHKKLNTTIISVTHEITSFINIYSNVLALKNGSVYFCGKVDELLAENSVLLDKIFDVSFEIETMKSGKKAVLLKNEFTVS